MERHELRLRAKNSYWDWQLRSSCDGHWQVERL